MKIECKLWVVNVSQSQSLNIGCSLWTTIIVSTKVVEKVSWVLHSVSAGLVNVYTKPEVDNKLEELDLFYVKQW